jgi:RNA polymerase sigma-70 factor (ECF subfamily)
VDDSRDEARLEEKVDTYDDSVSSDGAVVCLSEETDLVVRMWQGDEQAFHRLFVRYARPLCDVAFSYVHIRDVAQELVQDVFCRVWEQRERLAMPDNVRAYLYATIRHRALDYIRHQRVVRHVTEMPFEEGEYPGLGEQSAGVDERLVDQERYDLLLRAIAELPERQRRVFELRWYHHLSYAEIADVLGITVKGVESLRARAIEALQKKLRGVLEP